MRQAIICISIFLFISCTNCQDKAADCVDGASAWYRGKRNKTASGKTCQRWDTDKPHKPKHTPPDGAGHNYCRNPDNDLRGTWCYTTDNNTRWEYCNITKCPDDSLVIWTSYNSSTESTFLLQVHADPEVVRRLTDTNGSFNVSILTGSNRTMTEYWALAAHYHKNRLYYTDYRSEYVAVWDMVKKTSTKYLEGMAHGIECLAFDWKTENLYWTDSEFKWVMASDDSFKYYTPVYRTAPAPAYGLAIHSVKRYLIFSTYKALGSKIIRTDLAGKNEKVLFTFPNVFDVTGLAIDYTDDRLYWTDFTGYGGMIISSKLDGTNKTQHNYRGGSIFWGVAAYLDYLYVSDVHARFSITGERHYSVWIISKRTKQVYRYTLGGKPRGIAVYSHNEEYSTDQEPTAGECGGDNVACDHICLPRINATRECACSLGYQVDKNNKCKTTLVTDDYLLVADAGQGKVFQIPISSIQDKDSTNNTKYSIVPIDSKSKAATVAVDHKNQVLYWSDKKKSSVSKSSVDGTEYAQVVSSYANSIIVDPHNGQLFYSDNEKDTIMVSTADGSTVKTIVKPDPAMNNSSSIRMIALDIKYKYIYWTDTFSKEGNGKVMRCKYDGSNPETVLENLNWPHAITIDYKTNRLYVAEARNAVIYEIELESIVKINETSAKSAGYKKYDVSSYISRVSPYLIDLKIHQDMAYVVDGKSSRLEKFNLTVGEVSMSPFGPAEFFRITTLSVYSESFFERYIKQTKNPCNLISCQEMCVVLSNEEGKCLCGDGRNLTVSGTCIKDPNAPDTTAPEPVGCPDDLELSLPDCADSLTFSWTAPTWTDDITSTEKLKVSGPTSPASFSPGRNPITYTATDEVGNTGYCRFIISVLDNKCPNVPNARTGMKRSDPTCGNKRGSYFTVTCQEEGHVIWINSRTPNEYNTVPSYEVRCSNSLQWTTNGYMYNSKCDAPPTTTAPATTTETTTKKASTSPRTTKSVTTPKVTTLKPTPTTKKPTSPVRPRTTTGTSPQTKTPTASTISTNKPATENTQKSAVTVSLITTKGNNTIKNAPNSDKQTGAGGLTTGAVAAISVMVVVLVIIVIIVVIIAIRNRPSWSIARFPVLWKSNEDDGVKMESSGHSYEIMS